MRRLILTTLLLAPGWAQAADQCPAPALAIAGPAGTRLPEAPHSTSVPMDGSVRVSDTDLRTIPALGRLASRGAALSDIGTQHGMRAIFARHGMHFQVFYLTPDKAAVIGGVMWDEMGHNVTRDQVRPIAGTIPTMTYHPPRPGGAPAPLDALANTISGTTGATGVPALTMLIDPLCPFSIKAADELAPYVAAGRIRLRVIPISINDHENAGASTRAARWLLEHPGPDIFKTWRASQTPGNPVDGASEVALQTNMAAAQAIGLQGTPTLVWADRSGHQHQTAGLPDDLDATVAEAAP